MRALGPTRPSSSARRGSCATTPTSRGEGDIFTAVCAVLYCNVSYSTVVLGLAPVCTCVVVRLRLPADEGGPGVP